jgi:dephospho-CoA kinase
MGDPAARRILESLVHPAVQRRREALLDAAWKRGDQIVVNDIPLLFEALDPAQFDVVVFVDAPHTVRRTRLRALRGLKDEEADELLAAQAPADRKRRRSDFVIDNEGSFDALEHRAREVYDELVRRANAKSKA